MRVRYFPSEANSRNQKIFGCAGFSKKGPKRGRLAELNNCRIKSKKRSYRVPQINSNPKTERPSFSEYHRRRPFTHSNSLIFQHLHLVTSGFKFCFGKHANGYNFTIYIFQTSIYLVASVILCYQSNLFSLKNSFLKSY